MCIRDSFYDHPHSPRTWNREAWMKEERTRDGETAKGSDHGMHTGAAWANQSGPKANYSTRDFYRPYTPVSYTHLRAHETPEHLVCRLLLEKKKKHRDESLCNPSILSKQSSIAQLSTYYHKYQRNN
eukprot:TRINITY_DN65394_c0_g1_i1.p1 TRINITY_DN65394_c0_g1~~TRINITY_DN65394_c0_g1_i1.p1  ORF type:complete len:127 (+),score=19.08 TRINITY_DN65394_c0_g1_i1:95-475(+)